MRYWEVTISFVDTDCLLPTVASTVEHIPANVLDSVASGAAGVIEMVAVQAFEDVQREVMARDA